MKKVHILLSALIAAFLLVSFSSHAQTSCPPLPSENQLRWQEMEMYAFIHYSLNTYTDQEWGYGNEDLKLFNPSDLDCRQWARVCKQAGMKGIIFTAKHHCGFCMWPSKYTEYSVKNTPWKQGRGDVVKELADACREEGLKFAVYLSPWDRNHKDYGKPEYVTYFRNQLRELLTNYGDIFEVWFDGANGGDGWYGGANETRRIDGKTYYQWAETFRMIRELQPKAVIWNDGGDRGDLRWVGTEAGNVGETNWSLLNHDGEVTWPMLHYGLEDGDSWVPGETNTSIRPGWFYHETENEHVKSLSKLMDTYYKSVGRNSCLLLNFPIAPNGRIHPTDSLRGIAFNKMIHEVFKTDLAKKAKTKIQDNVTLIDFKKPTAFNRFVAEEDIRYGQRVKKFSLEAEVDGKWIPLKDELVEDGDGLTTIGHRRIICFPTVKATKIRFTVTDCKAANEREQSQARLNSAEREQARTEFKAAPIIKKLGVYLAPELTADIPDSGEKKSSKLHYFFSSPKQMMIDWDSEQTISGFRYLPPKQTKEGVVTHYTLWASSDWNHWEKLASGEFSNIVNNPIWQTIKFTPVKAKILRFDADRLADGERMAFDDIEILNAADKQNTAAVNLSEATIVYNDNDVPLVKQMAQVLADDIERVTGSRPKTSTQKGSGATIFIGTPKYTGCHSELKGTWERFAIDTKDRNLYITGSDARGLAYGVFHVSEAIGVSPWYWWADVPVDKGNRRAYSYEENYVSASPTIKYRGIFINDEDWGLKTWAAKTFEKELADIGPKTYDKVCELILRLKGNMLAPAMHSCTGAFYSHPESQVVADKWGIMITTSHCEPLLFNNAALSEWDKARDGEWNYETNSATILKKLDDRIRETAQYDNIYTMGMRGLHDEAMKGSKDPKVRARTLEKVFEKQRGILEKYKKTKATNLPQIFVPYKETLDIYDAGLKVPEDITLVWPDDNYGYMKRVSNTEEQRRKGHSGVYYHISYLGTPHDYLWLPSTAPMLMYHELKKAYDAGADRYWLLNIGDIKPMEVEMQQFFDMAYDFEAFNFDNVNRYQAQWLAKLFTNNKGNLNSQFQFILDNYYRLAWDRKPEFMGYEYEWSSDEENRLHDTDFSFDTGTAQKRLLDYENICEAYDMIEQSIDPSCCPALFEMLGYAVHSAYQMNRKFLYAQRNHETGHAAYAEMALDAQDKLEQLRKKYNEQLDGKWAEMMSELPPGFCAKYQMMPELSDKPTTAYRLPAEQHHPQFKNVIDLSSLAVKEPFRLIEGIGTDWQALQMGQPLSEATGDIDIPLPSPVTLQPSPTIKLCISVVPMWPVTSNRSNRFKVSVDGGEAVVCENVFKEWGPEWKLQVLENRKEFVVTLPLDTSRQNHTITLSIIDPGQIIQKITYE